VELDALHWEPNWTMAALETFRARVAAAVSGEAWVVEGNYAKVRDLVWPRAESLVWLDYPLWLIMGRLTRRMISRVATRELLWGTNRERLRDHLLSKDSLFLWALKTQPRYRREFPELLAQPQHAHLQLIRLTSPSKTMAWLTDAGA
jgi:adenylate kinase family enzyme